MKALQTTAITSVILLTAGFASAKNLSEADLSGIQSISSDTQVVWDVTDPVVKNAADDDDIYPNELVLTKDMKDANIELGKMVESSFAVMLNSNAQLKSKLTDSNSSDAHFQVSVYEWGLLPTSDDNLKPVVALRVDLVDANGESLWHTHQRVSQHNGATGAYSYSSIMDNSDRLESALGQAVDIAVNSVENRI